MTFSATIHVDIDVRSCPQLLEPAVVGCWSPVLLLPSNLEEHLSHPELEAVMAHELGHVRRHDNLTAAIHMLVEAVFWFHPLVWWIGARLLDERERACDEHVLEALGEPLSYATAILKICKLYAQPPLFCTPGVAGANITKRMEHIMSNRIGANLKIPHRVALAMVGAMALATPVIVGMMASALPAQTVKRAKDPAALVRMQETVLRYALFQIRDAIDRFSQKHQRYPRSLGQLVSEGYLTQIPVDPFTNRSDSWKVIAPKKGQRADGVYDVMSGSETVATNGTKYSTW